MGKAGEIEKILKVLDSHEIGKETIENCLYVLAMGKASKIERIFKVLDNHKIGKKTIERCLTVLASGKAEEIEKIFKVLDSHNIRKETIEKCLSVLARGKASEIEKIFKVLDDHKIEKEAIEKCLYVLATGKASEIEKIFKVLDSYEIRKETIENCLSVLARGKASEIEKILKILDSYNIGKESIEKCLTVLAMGKSEEIEKIFKVLEKNKIEKEYIEESLGFLLLNNVENIEQIFSEGEQYLNKYMKLKGLYDTILTKEQINQIVKNKNIDMDTFLSSIRGEENKEIYGETLKRKNGIYIGKSIPVQREYLNKNGEMLVNLSKTIAENFAHRYRKKDISEIESQAMEIIISKCGDITYNFDYNPDIVKRFIYKKVYEYLKGYNLITTEKLTDFSNLVGKGQLVAKETIEEDKEDLDLSNWNVNEEQANILKAISFYLEEKPEISCAVEKASSLLNIEEEKILEEIENIKESNTKEDIERGER